MPHEPDIDEIKASIGRTLQEIRTQAGLTQDDIVARVKRLSRSYVSRIEHGRHLPSWAILRDWCHVCHTTPPQSIYRSYLHLIGTDPSAYAQLAPGSIATTAVALRFARVWQASDTIDDVASSMGMTRQAVTSKASQLRSHGIDLKRMRRRNYRDWDALRDMIDTPDPRDDADNS